VRRHYENPPIVEALVELFFTGSQWSPTVPGRFYTDIQNRFPLEEHLDQIGLEVGLSSEGPDARLSRGDPRLRFQTSDRSQMVQLARDLLVFNQVRSNQQEYTHFEEWRPTVIEMLNRYRELARPAAIERMGVRYINRVVIPSPAILMEDYFTIYPQVPEAIGEHGPFLMRLEIPPLHPEHQMIVTFGSTPSEQEGTIAHLLDFYDIVVMGGPNSFGTVEQRLHDAHDNIITAFEVSITDKARGLFREVKHGRDQRA
jgi:uncharacterized protein (TIGR04255 family)